jgi:hypothetical protein
MVGSIEHAWTLVLYMAQRLAAVNVRRPELKTHELPLTGKRLILKKLKWLLKD